MMTDFQKRIDKAKKLIEKADCVIIGAGAGLSTAAGFEYSGQIFDKYFSDFKEKYGFNDMYSGGFYPFKTQEEKWAYWSRYVYLNRYKNKDNKLYKKLLDFVQSKDYFVITTNVDHQFQLAGFDKNRLFYMQGDYGLFQCSLPCHNKTYDNEKQILNMVEKQKDMKIPASLIPKCPVCGRDMEMNLRSDERFVQDEGWYQHARLYNDFIEKSNDKFRVLIEIGVGYNTPGIIKFPFEQMTFYNEKTYLIRINKEYDTCPREIRYKTILFNEDVEMILNNLK